MELAPIEGERLKGHYSVWVNGNWRMTFKFDGIDAVLVDLIINLSTWCERGESNPHGCYPLEPKSSASTNSATFARRFRGAIVAYAG